MFPDANFKQFHKIILALFSIKIVDSLGFLEIGFNSELFQLF